MNDISWGALLVFGSYVLAGVLIAGVVSMFTLAPGAVFWPFVICVVFGAIVSLIINHYGRRV